MKKELILLIILVISSFIFINPNTEWDEYVYLLNAKYFAGEKIYFEDIRPPLLPLTLSVFNLLNIESLNFLLPILLFTLLLLVFYKYAGDYKPLLLFMTFPIVLLYSQKFMTSIPSTLLVLTSVMLMKLHAEKKSNKFLYSSFLTASLAALTRYPLGLTYFIITILYLVFLKKKNIKSLIIAQLFFFLPIILWVYYIGVEPFYYAFLWASNSISFLHYFTNSPMIIGPSLLLLFFLFKYKYKREDLWFLTPLIVLFLFFQLFSNKEDRYLIPILPFLSILLIKCFKIKENNYIALIIIFFIISLSFSFAYFSSFCDNSEGLNELREEFTDINNVNLLSNFWPICSYYTGNTCYALIEPLEELNERIDYTNASYIIISDAYSYPSYAVNESVFSNYSMNKLINDKCEKILVYKVG